MKIPRIWIAVLVAGIVCNVLDLVVQGKLLTDAYYVKIDSMRQDTNPAWFVFGDFVAVIVLAWVLGRVSAAFGPSLKAGATAGFFFGVLANFPTWHLVALMFKGIPYPLVWIETIYGIIWYVIAGAILAALMEKTPPAPGAAGIKAA